MVEPLGIWKNTLKSLQTTDQVVWTSQLARWAAERTTMKLTLSNIVGPVTYTFNSGLFDSMLKTCATTDQTMIAAAQIANAWQAAALASPMMVLPGASLGMPSPATTWSVVVAVIDPPSVMAAKVVLMQGILSATAVSDGFFSKVAESFREAFLSLSFSISGINSLPIPSPLLAPFTRTA